MPAIQGPHHGFSLWDRANEPNSVYSNAYLMAALGSNIARVNVSWGGTMGGGPSGPPLEAVQGVWDYTQLDNIKAMVAWGRAANPAFKVIVMFDGLPDWVDGKASAHYTTTDTGANQYGIAVAQTLAYLGDACDFIELSNEPNQKITSSTPHATEIPADDYGRMAAYAIHWVDYCCGTSKNVVAGAVALRGGAPSFLYGSPMVWSTSMRDATNIQLYLLHPSDAVKRQSLQDRWRFSFHPYPGLGWNNGIPPASPSNTTPDRNAVDAHATVTGAYADFKAQFTNRKIWITETGVSSSKIGLNPQADFHHSQFLWASFQQPQLEGLVNFGFSDSDPMMGDPNSAWYQMGVKTPGALANKPAANTIQTDWALWN